MPKRGDIEARQADEVLAEFGRENLEALGEAYRSFESKVDVQKLLSWTIKEPLDDLLMPVFLAAVLTITPDFLRETAGRSAITGAITTWSGVRDA